jgi:RNA polymerase sigma factor (sigma-70 family)
MTAVPHWDIVGPSGSDAELARASAAGDRRAFAEIYDRYADRLNDFCIGMLNDRDGAADCVQDVFCIAATRLPQLREPDKLRPWLYSIARNEALRRIHERRRETPSAELPDTASGEPGPDTLAARTELARLIADAAGGLSDRDRSVLELAFRHGLGGPDLADALGVSLSNANTIVHRLRETIERSLGALLVSRRAYNNSGCQELAAILDGWDGHFNVLMRKRISRHIESCDICDEERRRLVSPVALLGAVPVFIPAPAWLRDRTLSEVQLTSAAKPMTGGRGDDDVGGRDGRGFLLPVALFIAALITASALIVVWLNQKDVAITPTELSTTAPAVSAPPPPQPPSAPPPPPPTASVKPAAPIPTAPPARRTVTVPAPSAAPTPVAPPPISEPTPEPPPPPPPPPPPAPPPAWPDWLPPWPPPPPVPPPPPPPRPDFVPGPTFGVLDPAAPADSSVGP